MPQFSNPCPVQSMFHQWLHLLGRATKALKWEIIHKTKEFEHSTPLITPKPMMVVKNSSLVIINHFQQFNLLHLGA
jgi:hypothetical protein